MGRQTPFSQKTDFALVGSCSGFFCYLQFLWLWNDYLVALVFLVKKNKTITLLLVVGEKGQDWHLMTSAALRQHDRSAARVPWLQRVSLFVV